MSCTILPMAILLLLFFISSTFATDLQIKSARQKRQLNVMSCTALTVPNGNVNYLQTNPMSLYAQGTTAVLQCNLGFTVTGTPNSICTNGAWSPPLGYCTQGLGGMTAFPGTTAFGLQNTATCLPMLAPLNGRLQYSVNSLTGTYTSGTSVQVMCNTGYTPSGTPQTSTCLSGVWNPAILGTCIGSGFGVGTTIGVGNTGGAQCPAAITPLNGQIQYNGIPSNGFYSSGSSATLMCNSGTYVSGSSTSTCTNGLWTPAFGVCTSSTGGTGGSSIGYGTGTQCLFPMAAPLGGTVSHSTGLTTGPFSEGASATLMCTAGSPTGTTVAVCQSGQWQPSFFTGCSTTGAFGSTGFGTVGFGTTMVGQCTAPVPSVVGGTVTYSQGGQFGPFPQGTFATLQCLNGQMASGASSASCMNGFWSPASLGPCGSTGFLGSTATGIGAGISNGFNNLANGLSNTVNNLQTSCIMGLLPPANGRITYSNAATFGPFPTGTIATLNCNIGYTASGQISASCGPNGVFFPSSLGTCVGSTGFSPSMSMTNSFGTSNTTAALATSSNCYDFPPVQNGQISYSPAGRAPYPLGSSATLMCQGSVASMASCGMMGWSPSQLSGCGSQAFGSG